MGWTVWGSNPSNGKGFLPPQYLNLLWHWRRLLSCGYWGTLSQGITQPEHKAENSHIFVVMAKNEWNLHLHSPDTFTVWTWLHFLLWGWKVERIHCSSCSSRKQVRLERSRIQVAVDVSWEIPKTEEHASLHFIANCSISQCRHNCLSRKNREFFPLYWRGRCFYLP